MRIFIPILLCLSPLLAQAQTCRELFLGPSQITHASPFDAILESWDLSSNEVLELRPQSKRIPDDPVEIERGQFIKNKIVNAIKSAKKDQIIISYSGIAHALDVFENLERKGDVAYFVPAPSKTTLPPIYEFGRRLLGDLDLSEKDQKIVLNILETNFKGHRLFEYVTMGILNREIENRDPLLIDSLIEIMNQHHYDGQAGANSEGPVRAIVIGETHYIQTETMRLPLPSPSDLKAQGINEIVLYAESVGAKTKMSLADLENTYAQTNIYRYYFRGLSPLAKSFLLQDIEASLNLKTVIRSLKTPVIINPAAYDLINQLKLYARRGIRITIRGLEAQ